MKDAYYFPHDYHARHDSKLAALIKEYGALGYGVYWDFIEILHEEGGKFEKFPKMFEGLSQELKVDEATLKQIFSASIKDFCLFKENKTHIWSDRVLGNLKVREEKKLQKVTAGRLGGILSGKKRSKTKHRFKQNEANEAKERKGKEIKGKEIKEPPEKSGPVNNPVFNDKEKAILEQVQAKTNIYALINDFNKTHKAYPPKELLIRVCQQFLDKAGEINEPYPYLKAALHRAAQDEAHLNLKKDVGMAQSLKDIFRNLKAESVGV